MLPKPCREAVLRIAHSIPLAGHLGRNKTTSRILQRFYWPTVFKDVASYCKSCSECQKTSTKRAPPAPLIPLPIIDEPFSRIAMDIVGPLPRSRSGKKYILVYLRLRDTLPRGYRSEINRGRVHRRRIDPALRTCRCATGDPNRSRHKLHFTTTCRTVPTPAH